MKLKHNYMFFLGLLISSTTGMAATLNGAVEVTSSDANNVYALDYVLSNPGSSPVNSIVIRSSDRISALSCSSNTDQGNSFNANAGRLAAGDSITCQTQVTAPADVTRMPVDIVALGTDSDGNRFRSKTSYTLLIGGTPADEAIGTVLVGAVHNDNDADFLFTTNDTIDYSFTVVNTGTAVLNNILVVDDLGTTITCPSTTLGLDSSFVCTSTFTVPDNNSQFDISNGATLTADGANGQPVFDDDLFVALPQLFETASLNAAKVPAITDDATPDGFASVGDEITYSIIITNANADDITIDSIMDPLPGLGAIICDATTQGGAAFGGVGSILPAGDTVICEASLIVTVADRTNGQINNNVSIDGTSVLFAAVNVNAAATVVIPSFQIVVEKVSTVLTGTFDFTLTNAVPNMVSVTTVTPGTPESAAPVFVDMLAQDVTITEIVPQFFTLQGASCVDALGAMLTTSLVDTTITIDGADVDVVNSSFQSPITCTFMNDAAPDISVTKTVADGDGDGIAEPGEQLDYTITLINDGGVPQNYAIGDIQETVPDNTTAAGGDDFDCMAGDPAATVCDTNAAVTVPASDGVNPGMVTLGFSVIVDDPLPGGLMTISNSVTVPGECPNTGGSMNDCDEDIPALPDELDLAIEKEASQNFVMLGDIFTYTITVTNLSLVVGPDAIVTDELPEQLEFVSTDGCMNDPDGSPVCMLGDIGPGETVSYEITVELISIPVPSSGLLENVATVSTSGVDVDMTNNTDSAIVGVIVAVPTLSNFGLLLLILMALGVSMYTIRSRRQF